MIKKPVLLFDFDGVIVASFAISHQSSNEVGEAPTDLATYRTFFHGNIFEHPDVANQNQREDKKISEDHPFYQRYVPRLMTLSPVEEMHHMIPTFAEDFTLFIITSTPTISVARFLEQHGLAKHFEKILGADVHTNKSHKIKMIFDEYSLAADDCLFITDTLGDVREAAKVGVQSVGVLWGFHEREDLQKGEPYAIIEEPSQLPGIIQTYFSL